MLENNKIIKLSIIVPIYKVEQYIERCIRSLMEQTMKENIEFIFVNDCTPDNSIQILQNVIQEYPNRSSQIRIYNNTKNIGLHETRKVACLPLGNSKDSRNHSPKSRGTPSSA